MHDFPGYPAPEADHPEEVCTLRQRQDDQHTSTPVRQFPCTKSEQVGSMLEKDEPYYASSHNYFCHRYQNDEGADRGDRWVAVWYKGEDEEEYQWRYVAGMRVNRSSPVDKEIAIG